MGKIFLVKLNTADVNGGEQFRYELSNFKSLTYDLTTPASPMPLPEETSKDAVIIKVEGNSAVLNIRWKLVDNNGVNLVSVPSGDTAVPSSTIREQLQFFRDTEGSFAPNSLNDKYRVIVRLTDSTDFWHYQDIIYDGTFVNFSFTMSTPELLTFNASVKFIEGKVENMFSADSPSATPNVVVTSPSNGTLSASWGAPYETGASAITSYKIQYRLYNSGNTWTPYDTNASETSARSKSNFATGLATGVYEVIIHAYSAAGYGKESQIMLKEVVG
tara:strand:+ start:2645 stop:3466 length:822 start_codon:yes stop_codon:yes gene_type:complete